MSTKALVLLTTRFDYDGGEILGCIVVTVPSDFDADADEARFCSTIPQMPLYAKWCLNSGKLSGRYVNKARKLWEANLVLRFGLTEYVVSEWQT